MKVAIVTFLLLLNCLDGFSVVLDNCVCGQMNPNYSFDDISNRIVNGTLVYPHKYPWMVAMQVYSEQQWVFVCGGSIISDRTILSAVHCMLYLDYLPYRFLTGMDVITTPSSDQIYYAQSLINHPLYFEIDEAPIYDIAMIVVDRPIKFSPLVSPICLPSPYDHELFLQQKVKAAGWGNIDVYTPEIEREIETLMETKLLLISNEECKSSKRKSEINEDDIDFPDDSFMCTFGGHTGVCAGDSGGPLFVNYGVNHHMILGVASLIVEECASGNPDVFAKVSVPVTLNWIYDVIKEAGGNVCRAPNSF